MLLRACAGSIFCLQSSLTRRHGRWMAMKHGILEFDSLGSLLYLLPLPVCIRLTVCLILDWGTSVGSHCGQGKQKDTDIPSSEQEIAHVLFFLISTSMLVFKCFFWDLSFYAHEGFVHTYVCVLCVSCARRGQEKASDPLELEWQTVVSCREDAGNSTQVLWGSSQCS